MVLDEYTKFPDRYTKTMQNNHLIYLQKLLLLLS